uniref:SCP domain-containing protein n=1 Tax=Meloidogyne enterolobii TaxID=390850 RepID=A0A6V7TU16_MELEN|nr:unnamed protein product [Meloidogyne enterolobii]
MCDCKTGIWEVPTNQQIFPINFGRSFPFEGNSSVDFAYLRLSKFENNMPLTFPEYQKIDYYINHENTSSLILNVSRNIISIPYSIHLNPTKLLNKRSIRYYYTKVKKWNWFKNTWKPKKTTGFKLFADKIKPISNQARASPLAILPPNLGPPLCQMITKMGWDANQIRRYIMEDAAIKRIHPQQFDVAHFKRAVIEAHNRYRRLHGTNDLSQDGACEIAAKRWADSVSRQPACLTHEPQQRFGESLFFYSTLQPLISDPETMAEATVRTFYIEGRDYRRSARWVASRHGHFTQMLWRDTNRIGIGVSIIPQPAGWGCMPPGRGQAWIFYVVLRYDPPGNRVISQRSFDENVLPVENKDIQAVNCLAI